MSNKNVFIMTTDEETSKKLENLGFTLVDSKNNTWTFLNNSSELLNFEKIKYTNKLNI